MAMNVTPDASSTDIREAGRMYENAHDYSESGTAAPLQFVINNEPHLPRNREQKKLVRSHAKRQSRAVQKRKNTLPVRRRAILQKSSPQWSAQSKFSITSANTNVTSEPQTPSTDTKAATALSVGSESDIGLTPESSYLASEDSEARFFSTTPELDSPLPSLQSLNLDAHKFDRWVFDTTSPYTLLQDEGAPALCLSARTWPFPKPIGAEKPKFSIFMPSRVLPAPNFNLPRGCMHKSALVVPHIINSREYYSFKVGTIQWINDRLDTLSVGTGDATIGSILLLINFELMRGNVTEARYYMDGVQQIVNLRGGLGNVNNRNVLARILVIDLLVAALSKHQPRFSQPTLFPADLLGAVFYKVADSPLTTQRTMKIALKVSSFGERGARYLQRAQMITMHRIAGTSCSFSEYKHDLYEPKTRMDQDTSALFRIIQQTSDIYLGALQTPQIPFSSPINRKSTVALCQAVESPANDDVWDRFPGIFTWVLLVGCAAAEEGSTEYNFFVCLLIKVALGAGYGWLDALTEAVKTFIKVKELSEGCEKKNL